jgi:hypothetical protein
VVADGGRVFRADAAVVTVPLGVLKRGGLEFDPPLPPRKVEKIDKVGFGVLNKVGGCGERGLVCSTKWPCAGRVGMRGGVDGWVGRCGMREVSGGQGAGSSTCSALAGVFEGAGPQAKRIAACISMPWGRVGVRVRSLRLNPTLNPKP